MTNAYARGAKQNAAKIFEDSPVNEIIVGLDPKGNRFIQGVGSEKGNVSNASYICNQNSTREMKNWYLQVSISSSSISISFFR